MRSQRRTKKKLIIAFHFVIAKQQTSGRAAWNCESCRRHGLEVKRRCGFLPPDARSQERIVWGRKHAETRECPQSFITAESLALLEEFFVRQRLGIPNSMELQARKVDAFLILRDEMELEYRDVTSQN